ncbi:MAG: uracil-DNA glycosylase [Candidatus Rhabdochlamydia sp.]|jgi:uracil-DNA glycosylase|nr:uracil-DNA glycosylase [Chlamydiota bacterium]
MVMKLAASWHEVLKEELSKPYIADLKKFLAQEKAENKIIYPSEELIFNAFLHTPFENVKVVIMGQDPYHGPGQAHGLSFSVPCGIPQPPSLKNIFKEQNQDLNINLPKEGCLSSWAKQGVLLLNATLTVRSGEPKSHYGRGWEVFTDAVVAKLVERKDPLVFVLWGKSAQEKIGSVLEGKTTSHVVLTAAHPSPYSVLGFFGCHHFSQINEALKKWGKDPINWQLP